MLRLPRRWGGCGAPPVLFDAFVSLQETAEDRGAVDRWLGSRRLELEDRLACRWTDRVLVDTDAHGDHFATQLATPRSKIRRLWVGADDDVMRPRPEAAHDDFRVFVYASFIPLHGLEHVVRAAAILEKRGEKVSIDLIGSGDTESSVRALTEQLGVHSITFVGRRPYDELPEWMARSDLCLGIFGTSPKARRVIPNKVFDALACERAVITGDTPAVRELLHPGDDVWVCPPGDPEALADSIVTLRHDNDLRRSIAEAATPASVRLRASTPSPANSPPSLASSAEQREDAPDAARRRYRVRHEVPHATSEHAPTAHTTTTRRLRSGTAARCNRLDNGHVADVPTVGQVCHAPLERPSASSSGSPCPPCAGQRSRPVRHTRPPSPRST